VLLAKADMADKQALGTRADSIAAHNSKLSHDVGAGGRRFSPVLRGGGHHSAAVHPPLAAVIAVAGADSQEE
jgi:hypothetical protein